MPLPCPRRLLLLLFLAAGPAGAAPGGRTAELSYLRGPGAERCPDEPALRRSVSGRLGYDPFRARDDRRVVARIEAEPMSLVGRIELLGPGGDRLGSRELRSSAPDCEALADELGLAISIAIDPVGFSHRAGPVRARVEPAPKAPVPSGPEVQAGAGLLGSLGASSGPTLGALVGAQVRWPTASVGLEGRADLPRRLAAAGGQVTTSLSTLSAVPCLHRGPLGACGLLSAGLERSAGQGYPASRTVATPYLAMGARALAEWAPARRLTLQLHLSLLTPLVRTAVEVGPMRVWATPPLQGALGLAAAATLP